jgi:histidine triad (HIT) family protein
VSHAPAPYDCPFCRIVQGRFDDAVTWSGPDDIAFRDDDLCAFVSAGQFSTEPAYPGHVLVIPVEHHENIYDLPDDLLGRIAALRRRVSLAFSRMGAEGTSSRQHNEPAGNQDVWHYHEHVFPRYAGDELYAQHRTRVDDVRRSAQAARIRETLEEVLTDLPLGRG